MQLIDGRSVFSATDLVGFLACEHLTNLERAALAGLVQRPMRVDPELDRVVKRGMQHERRFLDERRAEGLRIVEITVPDGVERGAGYRAAADATVAAMQAGAEVIYQATFFDGRWLGFADFLRRVDAPSALGPWSYEVWDTKLARHTKGSAVLQLSLYSEQLARLQGRRPELMYVALGGSAHDVDRPPRGRLLRLRAGRQAPVRGVHRSAAARSPTRRRRGRIPVEHCDICRWQLGLRGDDGARTDDLSLVAGITAHQRTALRTRDVPTRTRVGRAGPADGPAARGDHRHEPRARARAGAHPGRGRPGAARRPLRTPRAEPPARRLARTRSRLAEPGRPSRGDLFFDIEGDPFALEDGIDYLFGVLEPGLVGPDGGATFHAWWSIDRDDVTPDAERRAFEAAHRFLHRPAGGRSWPAHLPLRAVRAVVDAAV